MKSETKLKFENDVHATAVSQYEKLMYLVTSPIKTREDGSLVFDLARKINKLKQNPNLSLEDLDRE